MSSHKICASATSVFEKHYDARPPSTDIRLLSFVKKPEQFAYFWVAILSRIGLTTETGAHTSQPHIILLLIGSTWADEQ